MSALKRKVDSATTVLESSSFDDGLAQFDGSDSDSQHNNRGVDLDFPAPPTTASKKTTDAHSEDGKSTEGASTEESVLEDIMRSVGRPALEPKRPLKKAKAVKKNNVVVSVTTKDDISSVVAAAAARAPSLSDYEKCSIFPQKLMQLLKNEEAPDAIWWLEDGAFAIEQEKFTKVMNKVSRTSKKKVKLDSILRNLYRWGFKKLKDRDLPPNVLAYSHPKFRRDVSVELQTFAKKAADSSSSSSSVGSSGGLGAGLMPPPTALARALSARARAGYGDNWNEEGAADKTTMMQGQFSLLGGTVPQFQQASMMMPPQPQQHQHHHFQPETDNQRMMLMLQQQQQQQQQHQQQHYHHQRQQQRQMLLQQELLLHEQQQRQQQALLLEAAAAERAAMGHYASQRYGGGGGGGGGVPGAAYPFNPHQYPF